MTAARLNPLATRLWADPAFASRSPPDWRNTSGNFTTIPEYFKDRGYITAGMGKIFHAGSASGLVDDPSSCATCRGDNDADYSWTEPYFETNAQPHEYAVGHRYSWIATESDKGPLQDDYVREHAINTLANISANRGTGKDTRPFFMAVGFHKPHLPLVFPERFLSYYPIDEVALPSNPDAPMNMPLIAWQGYGELRQYQDVSNITDKPGQFVHPDSHLLPDAKVRELRRAYFAAMSYADDNVGQVLDALNNGQVLGADNLRDSTIVCALSDHGWSLGEHGLWDKHTNFFINTQAPLMFRVPGQTDGGIFTDQIASTTDVFPTLVDLVFATAMPRCATGHLSANAKAEKFCTEGNSLVPLISDPLTPVKVAAYSFFDRPIPTGGALADVKEALKDQQFTPDYKWSKADDWSKANASSSRFMRYRRPKHGISLVDLPSRCINGSGCVMGYSMVTRLEGCELRYTEWVRYEGERANWKPTWDEVYGRELYNHSCYCSPTDPRRHPVSAIPDQYLTPMFFVDILENNNTYSAASVAVANELQWRLRRGWELNFELDSLSTSEKRALDAAPVADALGSEYGSAPVDDTLGSEYGSGSGAYESGSERLRLNHNTAA